MDTGLLNLEEHFSTYYVCEPDEQSCSDDNNRSYFNEWEDERELNGDIGLIPEPSSFCGSLKGMSDITDSPPSLLFQKMIDWSTSIYVDGVDAFPPEEAVSHHFTDQDVEQKLQTNLATSELSSCFNDKDVNNFDLAKYINESAFTDSRKVKSVGKKIDKQAQKYIIEDKDDNFDTSDEVDVETVFEGASLPVLEANDAFSLLEQFEASEKPPLANAKHNENLSSDFGFSSSLVNNLEMDVNHISSSSIEIFDKIPKAPIDIFDEDVNLFEDDSQTVKESPQTEILDKPKEQEKSKDEEVKTKQEAKTTKPQPSESNTSHNYTKNKQILDALPQELIARINESGKRKTITVIPPIPAKKRGASRSTESVSIHRNKIVKVAVNEQVHFDHDYCATPSPYPKEPQKDSGFQSSEEDDRSVIRNQPTVKTADGKLMVSLLKVNTIRSNNHNQKKKLNLEEYKKRRLINSNATSQSNSPASSTCSSPLPEDENLKRLKHQEKLMKMAADLLNTPAKSTKTDVALPALKPVVQNPPPQRIVVPQKITPPPDLEVKTYVSIGTNTDISSINCNKTILASTQQLEEIKPLLQKVSNKINSNSFITSLIENIPKVKTKTTAFVKSENQEVVREDKIIHYLKKDREPVKTVSVGSQTDFDEGVGDDMESRYRRRIDRSPSVSSSGSSRTRHRRRRSSSSSSRSSHSSYSSSSSSTSSRDNYGFVTFANKEDAYEAVEHGNDGHVYPKYDLSFGGRRIFCKTSYSDLDNMREDDYNYYTSRAPENSFDALLRAAQEKIRKRKP
ncbi:hypothetical protein TcasGA2_TC011963 [Tribolium castaneum]|uniref:Uncharacterized protein n=1 Tax=Tribolium castaneum TaxID=7070 RepID=D6X2Z7_TRICA|nr:hypothetical protein TcasGA2_TC011963 [Tribolium castaneum]